MAKLWEPLSKDLLNAGTLFAEEATYMHDETDWMPNGRKIS
jgi:hypothetical protein